MSVSVSMCDCALWWLYTLARMSPALRPESPGIVSRLFATLCRISCTENGWMKWDPVGPIKKVMGAWLTDGRGVRYKACKTKTIKWLTDFVRLPGSGVNLDFLNHFSLVLYSRPLWLVFLFKVLSLGVNIRRYKNNCVKERIGKNSLSRQTRGVLIKG